MHALEYTQAPQSIPASATKSGRSPLRWAAPLTAVALVALAATMARPPAPADEAAWLQRLASNGDSGAQLELGLAYRDGRDGLKVDRHAQWRWLERAAQGGSAYAADLMANAYATGDSIASDPKRAQYWWQVAADQGNQDAQRHISGATPGTLDEVGKILDGEAIRDQSGDALVAHARGGDALAEFQLSERYRDGSWGVQRNPALAQQWLKRAAADGNPAAQQALANNSPS